MKLIPIAILAAFLIVACNVVQQDAEITMRLYGGFLPVDIGDQVIMIDAEHNAVYQVKDRDGAVIGQATRKLSDDEYTRLINAVQASKFNAQKDVPPSDLVADAASADITVVQGDSSKTITIGTYVPEQIPQDLKLLIQELEAISQPLAEQAYKQVQQGQRDIACGLYRDEQTNEITCFKLNEQPAGYVPFQKPEIGIPYACYVENGQCLLAQ